MMSMLHALAAEKSPRETWWIYGARNRVDHPFADESHSLLKQLSRGREVWYTAGQLQPTESAQTSMLPGHIDTALLQKLGVSRNTDFYLCGPTSFLKNMGDGLKTWGVITRERVHGNLRCSRSDCSPVWRRSFTILTCHRGRPAPALRCHSRAAGLRLRRDQKFAELA